MACLKAESGQQHLYLLLNLGAILENANHQVEALKIGHAPALRPPDRCRQAILRSPWRISIARENSLRTPPFLRLTLRITSCGLTPHG